MRRREKRSDPIEYLRLRIDMLAEERIKNDDEVAHMVLDKCCGELSYILEMLERQESEKTSKKSRLL
jgi:hypothetical protein